MNYIKFFSDIAQQDIPTVGGKNAALGEMIRALTHEGIRIPQGFAVIADGYWHHIDTNHLREKITELLTQLSDNRLETLQKIGSEIRHLISRAPLPNDLTEEIIKAYQQLSHHYKKRALDVAVRSSATAEDLPTASFAGQQETYLNIKGDKALLEAVKNCMASLFTDRAIAYRQEHGFDHMKVGLSVAVQKMVRSDRACSGVVFTLDTETGFKDAIVITSAYGLGENIVKGVVNPDEFMVHKPTLLQGFRSIIQKRLGTKTKRLIYAVGNHLKNVAVPKKVQQQFSLSDDEILELARWSSMIEDYYSNQAGRWVPMDIEWAKDGIDGQLYVVQARPETVHARDQRNVLETYQLTSDTKPKVLVQGQSIGAKIVSGTARVVQSITELTKFAEGDIIVTSMTDPDWMPILRKASGIVTNLGGRTCHAAIVSRELGISAIIGTQEATKAIRDTTVITLDCSQGAQGFVYQGEVPFEVKRVQLESLPKPPCEILINLADPVTAFKHAFLPVNGVGLARLEFIINSIGIHPMAICQPDKLNKKIERAIKSRALAYADIPTFFVDTLAQGIAMIAAAFYPRPVTVRLTDFKTNEYRNLLGGEFFEPREENPMLGFRGAIRYTSPAYAPAFALELAALKKVRHKMGLTNVQIMVPFVRTVEEAQATVDRLADEGFVRGKDSLKLIMMVEIPSNVILLEEFARYFDSFSIGSNDLTQLTLGVDRDSGLLSVYFDERDPAVKKMMALAVQQAHRIQKYISICGQAPSDFPEIAHFLIEQGINALSLNVDAVIPFLQAQKV